MSEHLPDREHWYAPDGNPTVVVEMTAAARVAVDRTGNIQNVHLHAKGGTCNRGCFIVERMVAS